jgi:hypothetical protein
VNVLREITEEVEDDTELATHQVKSYTLNLQVLIPMIGPWRSSPRKT